MGTGAVWVEDLLEPRGGHRSAAGTAGTLTVGSKRKEEKHTRVD